MLRVAITSPTQTASFGVGMAPIQYLDHIHHLERLERLLPCPLSLDPASKAPDVQPPIDVPATFLFLHLRGVDAITTPGSCERVEKETACGEKRIRYSRVTRVRG